MQNSINFLTFTLILLLLFGILSCKEDDKCESQYCLNGGACNPETGNCECPQGYTGEHCETKVTNPGYVCQSGTCVLVADGAQYTSLSACQAACSTPPPQGGYNCVNGNCQAVTSGAQYTSLSACQTACSTPPPQGGYNCVNGNCVYVTSGAQYTSLSACQTACVSACFTVNNNNCQAPCTVTFSNCSTNASSYQWNFGDGTTSTAVNPNKTYSTPGTYTVQLTASNQPGANSTTTQQINITGSSNAPVMKSIPGGTFTMGCNLSVDPNCESVEPTRSVLLFPYQISETEVTQAQWQGLMGSNPSYFQNCPQCPVEGVTWYDAVVYCNRLSESLGLEPCYYSNSNFTSVYGKSGSTWTLPNSGTVYWKTSAKGYRLPTEAEWERAARDGVSNQIYSGGNDINTVAWYDANSGGKTQPVKQKPANGTPNYRLYDMSGNVQEWCYDWYGPYPPGSQTNPTGPTSGFARVGRGGSWLSAPQGCRVAGRGLNLPEIHGDFIGFRLARTP